MKNIFLVISILLLFFSVSGAETLYNYEVKSMTLGMSLEDVVEVLGKNDKETFVITDEDGDIIISLMKDGKESGKVFFNSLGAVESIEGNYSKEYFLNQFGILDSLNGYSFSRLQDNLQEYVRSLYEYSELAVAYKGDIEGISIQALTFQGKGVILKIEDIGNQYQVKIKKVKNIFLVEQVRLD